MQKSAGTSSCKVDPDLGDFQLNGWVGSSCKRVAVEDVAGTIGVLLSGGGCVCGVVFAIRPALQLQQRNGNVCSHG